jgi:hypothetical protein
MTSLKYCWADLASTDIAPPVTSSQLLHWEEAERVILPASIKEMLGYRNGGELDGGNDLRLLPLSDMTAMSMAEWASECDDPEAAAEQWQAEGIDSHARAYPVVRGYSQTYMLVYGDGGTPKLYDWDDWLTFHPEGIDGLFASWFAADAEPCCRYEDAQTLEVLIATENLTIVLGRKLIDTVEQTLGRRNGLLQLYRRSATHENGVLIDQHDEWAALPEPLDLKWCHLEEGREKDRKNPPTWQFCLRSTQTDAPRLSARTRAKGAGFSNERESSGALCFESVDRTKLERLRVDLLGPDGALTAEREQIAYVKRDKAEMEALIGEDMANLMTNPMAFFSGLVTGLGGKEDSEDINKRGWMAKTVRTLLGRTKGSAPAIPGVGEVPFLPLAQRPERKRPIPLPVGTGDTVDVRTTGRILLRPLASAQVEFHETRLGGRRFSGLKTAALSAAGDVAMAAPLMGEIELWDPHHPSKIMPPLQVPDGLSCDEILSGDGAFVFQVRSDRLLRWATRDPSSATQAEVPWAFATPGGRGVAACSHSGAARLVLMRCAIEPSASDRNPCVSVSVPPVRPFGSSNVKAVPRAWTSTKVQSVLPSI